MYIYDTLLLSDLAAVSVAMRYVFVCFSQSDHTGGSVDLYQVWQRPVRADHQDKHHRLARAAGAVTS